MNFFKKILTGRIFQGREELPPVTYKRSAPDEIIKFTCMESTYILEDFGIRFHQEVNEKGKPSGLTKGGIMRLTFCEPPDYYINEWMCRERLVREGTIRFLSGKAKVDSGSEFEITFTDGYCIGYEKQLDPVKRTYSTTLTISPRYIRLGDEEFMNRWKEVENLPYYIRSGK